MITIATTSVGMAVVVVIQQVTAEYVDRTFLKMEQRACRNALPTSLTGSVLDCHGNLPRSGGVLGIVVKNSARS